MKKIIIIGNGSIANKYKKLFSLYYKDFKIFCIPSRKFSKAYKRNLSSLQLIKENKFDLAIICSPANFHIDHALFFAKNNTNLLIEKPLSNILNKKVYTLKKIINKNNISCHVGYIFKYSAAAQKLKTILQRKIIGKVQQVKIVCESFLPNWRKKDYKKSVSAKKELGGGVINELSHEIHLMLWFFGVPYKISSYNYNSGILDINCEDNSSSNFSFKNDMSIFMNLSFSKKKKKRFINIYGTSGNLQWNILQNKIIIKNNKKKIFKFKKENLYKKQIDFILKDSKKILVSINDGINTLKLINQMKRNSI